VSSGVCPECGATGDFHGLCPECRYGSEFLRPPRPLRNRATSAAPFRVAEVQLKRKSAATLAATAVKPKRVSTAKSPARKAKRLPTAARPPKRPAERTAPNEVVSAASKALAAVSDGNLSRRQQKSALELAMRWLNVTQEVPHGS
jgi:hypothetical protein